MSVGMQEKEPFSVGDTITCLNEGTNGYRKPLVIKEILVDRIEGVYLTDPSQYWYCLERNFSSLCKITPEQVTFLLLLAVEQ